MDSEDSRQIRFLKLYTANELAIRAYVRTLVPSRDDVEEVMQEVAVVLWKKFADYPTGEDFRKWAFAVSRYEALAWLRDRARDRLVFNQDVLDLIAKEAEVRSDYHQRQREALDRCLEKLPQPQRELVQQAYRPGTRIDQLAAHRGQSAMSLYKLLQRIRTALLECTRQRLLEEGLA
jgi:RNA polymerase sigma-70 factor (ECF subfamily)